MRKNIAVFLHLDAWGCRWLQFIKNFGQPVELQLQSLYDYIITSFQAIAIIVDARWRKNSEFVTFFTTFNVITNMIIMLLTLFMLTSLHSSEFDEVLKLFPPSLCRRLNGISRARNAEVWEIWTELNVLDVSFDRDIMHLNIPFKNFILLYEINNGQKIFKKLTAKINLKKM